MCISLLSIEIKYFQKDTCLKVILLFFRQSEKKVHSGNKLYSLTKYHHISEGSFVLLTSMCLVTLFKFLNDLDDPSFGFPLVSVIYSLWLIVGLKYFQ